MSIQRICILGGSGFVGQHLAARLNELNIQTKVLTRHREKHRELLVLPLIETIEADVHDQTVLEQQFEDCDAVINLIGILNERGHSGAGFRKAHVELTRKVIDACRQAGVSRLLHMSALHADAARGTSYYLRTKGEAEDYLHTFHREVNVTSFRPSVIFGPGDSFFNRFAGLLKFTPYFFPLACAGARFAPVYVGDIVEQFTTALDNPETFGKRFDICGPKIYTLKELVEYTAKIQNLRRHIIGIPKAAAFFQALLMEYFVPGKPFSLDNYDSLKIDSICRPDGKNNITAKTAVETIVPTYLAGNTQRNRYNQFRKKASR